MKNKVLAMIFSLVVAFGLWLFVITVVSPESEKTYFDIPVVLQNKEALSQRKLMIVSDTPTVTLALKSDRSILNELNENNINVIVNLATVEKPGAHNLTYTISYPGNIPSGSISVQSSSTDMISLKVENRITKEVPLVVTAKEGTELPQDYHADLTKAQFVAWEDNLPVDKTHVEISGPESVVSQITQAVVDLDLNGQEGDIVKKEEIYTLCDEDGKAVNADKVTTNIDLVDVKLPVVKEKAIAISTQIIPGMGAEESNATVSLSQQSIVVRGEKTRVEALPLAVTIPVDLTKHFENITYEVELSELGLDLSGMEILTGKTKVTVELNFDGVKNQAFEAPVKIVNLPKTMEIASKTDTIKVTVRGPVEIVEQIQASDFEVKVDCAGVTEGRKEIDAAVTLTKYPNVAIIGVDRKVTVDVKLIPPEPAEPTESDTTTVTIPKIVLS